MNVEDVSKEIKDRAADASPDVKLLLAQAVEAINKVVDDVSRLLKADPADTVAAIKDAGKAASDNTALSLMMRATWAARKLMTSARPSGATP